MFGASETEKEATRSLPEPPRGRLSCYASLIVRGIFLVVACLFWAVLGSIFWVCLAARTLSVYTAGFLHAMFTGQQPASMQAQLHEVSDVWFRGFRYAYDSLFGTPRENPVELRFSLLLLQIVGSTVWWFMVLVAMFPARMVPAIDNLLGQFRFLITRFGMRRPLLSFVILVVGAVVGFIVRSPATERELSELRKENKVLKSELKRRPAESAQPK